MENEPSAYEHGSESLSPRTEVTVTRSLRGASPDYYTFTPFTDAQEEDACAVCLQHSAHGAVL